MKIHVEVFWILMPCTDAEVQQRFGGLFRLHLHGEKLLSYYVTTRYQNPEDSDLSN